MQTDRLLLTFRWQFLPPAAPSAGVQAEGVFLPMLTMREKRQRRFVVYVGPSLAGQLELFKEEDSNVISMSDYLHDVIEDFCERKSVIRITRQRIGRRLVNS